LERGSLSINGDFWVFKRHFSFFHGGVAAKSR
jgi:hypothetical protein